MRVAFYEHYKINEIRNNSLSEMLLDAVYNHDYKTFRNFAKEGLIAVMQLRGEDIEKRPRNWKDVPPFLNDCTDKEQEAFYNAFVQRESTFSEQSGYIKKYKGLKKRAAKFAGKYRAYAQKAENVREKFAGRLSGRKKAKPKLGNRSAGNAARTYLAERKQNERSGRRKLYSKGTGRTSQTKNLPVAQGCRLELSGTGGTQRPFAGNAQGAGRRTKADDALPFAQNS